MDLLIIIVIVLIGAALLTLTLFGVLWKIVSPAVDNLLDWLIHTFGNERAAKEIEEKVGGFHVVARLRDPEVATNGTVLHPIPPL